MRPAPVLGGISLSHIARPDARMAVVGWYGGKGLLIGKMRQHLPLNGTIFVDAYVGGGTVLFNLLRPFQVEVINDINGEVVNLFRVLQDPVKFERFAHRVIWTPYSLDEFRRALTYNGDDEIERAWAFYVKHNQGYSGLANTEGDWSREFSSSRGMSSSTSKWRGRMRTLQDWHDRMTRVVIENNDALEVIARWDSPDTVFYLDPPYIQDTRAAGSHEKYEREQDDKHHESLVDLLLTIQGQAALSGYAHPIYQPLEAAGWERIDIKTVAHSAGKVRARVKVGEQRGGIIRDEPPERIESLWVKRHDGPQGQLALV